MHIPVLSVPPGMSETTTHAIPPRIMYVITVFLRPILKWTKEPKIGISVLIQQPWEMPSIKRALQHGISTREKIHSQKWLCYAREQATWLRGTKPLTSAVYSYIRSTHVTWGTGHFLWRRGGEVAPKRKGLGKQRFEWVKRLDKWKTNNSRVG
jgi:hypothetical protein